MKKINRNEEFIDLSNGDKKYKFIKKWPIYYLDILNKNGIWMKFQNKLIELKLNNELEHIRYEMTQNFFHKRSDIDFEVTYFSSMMKKCIFFKYKNKMYCYTLGKITRKNGRKIYCRFYFDPNKVFSLDMNL